MTSWIKCLTVAAVVVALTACGGAAQSATPPTAPTTAAGGTAAVFCGQLRSFDAAATAAAHDTQVSQAKRDWRKAMNLLEGITNVPANLKSNMAAAINDLKAIFNWFQGRGTQADLNLTSVPAPIAAPVANLTNVATPIVNYAKAHCGSSPS